MRFVTVTCVATAFECIFRDKTVKAIIIGDRPSKTEGANRALVLSVDLGGGSTSVGITLSYHI